MSITRREFVRHGAAAGLALSLPDLARDADSDRGRRAPQGYEPWLELDAGTLLSNVRVVSRLAGGRPLVAVVKNNAYGTSLTRTAPVLERAPEVTALAVVKVSEAETALAAGVRKPVLLMAVAENRDVAELVRGGLQLGVYDDGAPDRLRELSRQLGAPVPVHFYLDTGINRVGMPYHRALPWMERIASEGAASVQGTFMTFTESAEFDPEQLRRFQDLTVRARERGVPLGRLHACSSQSMFERPEAHFDQVRTGLVVYGAYPAAMRAVMKETPRPEWEGLVPAFRLSARVVRVERLRPGDSVSYGRNYVAERPTWVASLPVGHADGYPRTAVRGCEVLIGGRLYPVIGAVSASHTIVEVGEEPTVAMGDTAVLVGPDRPEVHPNTVAERAGVSVYDVLMHLSAQLPVEVVGG